LNLNGKRNQRGEIIFNMECSAKILEIGKKFSVPCMMYKFDKNEYKKLNYIFMYKICQAKTKKDIVDFVKFPFKLYKNHPYWVPPIINDEVNYFNPELNLLLKKV
jgi:hypothetical protein